MSRDRVLIVDVKSVEWCSLTFSGERHELELRLAGPESAQAANRLADGLEDAEFDLPGIVVADIALAAPPHVELDGSTVMRIDALTVVAD